MGDDSKKHKVHYRGKLHEVTSGELRDAIVGVTGGGDEGPVEDNFFTREMVAAIKENRERHQRAQRPCTPDPLISTSPVTGFDGFADPPALKMAVKCGNQNCGYTTFHPLGKLDPLQGRCAHAWRLDMNLYAFVCTGCRLEVKLDELRDAGVDLSRRYDREGNALADVCMMLRDENTKLLAENARLRRKLGVK